MNAPQQEDAPALWGERINNGLEFAQLVTRGKRSLQRVVGFQYIQISDKI